MNRLACDASRNKDSAEELRRALEGDLEVYLNRFPDQLPVSDCDVAGLRSGDARDIKVQAIGVSASKEFVEVIIEVLYPRAERGALELSTFIADVDRTGAGIAIRTTDAH